MFVEEKASGEVKELDEASDLLLKAVAHIEAHGWCQKDLATIDGRVCLVGALHAADGSTEWNRPTKVHALERARKAIGCRSVDDVADWNDERGRTKEQVIDKLLIAAFSS